MASSFKEIFEERKHHTNTFLKSDQLLIKKKEKLFKQDISRWELKPESYAQRSELLQDFNLAQKYMLPKETEEMKKLRNNHILMTN